MKFIRISLLCLLLVSVGTSAQTLGEVTGVIANGSSLKPLKEISVSLMGTSLHTVSDMEGKFVLQDIPTGAKIIQFEHPAYELQRFPISVETGEKIDLGQILLQKKVIQQNDLSVISLSEEELSNDEGGADNTAGLLQSSKDVFLNAAAYDFSSTFFRARGYNSKQGKILVNGTEMNKMFNGRPQWSNWGGLNDLQRNQEFSNGLAASEATFGGISGANNFIMRAAAYSKGGRISMASANRSYKGRLMASYASGVLKSGWAYALLLSRRYANEGYNAATLYDANSFLISVEKRISDAHSLNFTSFYTPNRRGKSSPNTQEAYDLKNTTYNAYWGNQSNQQRNSRERQIKEPVFMLNHYWNWNENTSLNTNMVFQKGSIGNSRIDYGGTNLISDSSGNEYIIGGGSNPDPTYYQKLPSYFLRDPENPDYEGAYLALQNFQTNGQLNWQRLYETNSNSAALGGNSIYILYEDRNDDTQLSLNSIFRTEFNENCILNGSISYRHLQSENYALVKDLLGGTGYLNVDSFAETIEEAQNDLQNPNRIASTKERFKYNYEMKGGILDAFAQAQFQYDKMDFYVSAKLAVTNYQRNGLYENGRFPGSQSLGPSEKIDFLDPSFKGGITYKISGRHLIDFNAGFINKAPSIQNSFSNMRENNNIVRDLKSETILSSDLSYILRTPKTQARITGYYSKFSEGSEISVYYADGIYGIDSSETSAFVQEVLTQIEKRHLGIEIGIGTQITSTIKLKTALALGEVVYSNNPNLYLTSDAFDEPLEFGASYLKNYHVAGGPQTAISVGFEYRDPNYWWFSMTGNAFSNAYLDISPLARTANFKIDPIDGQPFNDYDPEIARNLLAQEEFDSYFLLNAVGGKSWKIDNYYAGFFTSISNILNTKYKTGGFEQSRNANYRTLKEDKSRNTPIFGPKYWFGYGTTYYLNLYLRF